MRFACLAIPRLWNGAVKVGGSGQCCMGMRWRGKLKRSESSGSRRRYADAAGPELHPQSWRGLTTTHYKILRLCLGKKNMTGIVHRDLKLENFLQPVCRQMEKMSEC